MSALEMMSGSTKNAWLLCSLKWGHVERCEGDPPANGLGPSRYLLGDHERRLRDVKMKIALLMDMGQSKVERIGFSL